MGNAEAETFDSDALMPIFPRTAKLRRAYRTWRLDPDNCPVHVACNCDHFASDMRPSLGDPVMCTDCAQGAVRKLVLLCTLLVTVTVGLVTFITMIVRSPSAAKRWVSSMTIVSALRECDSSLPQRRSQQQLHTQLSLCTMLLLPCPHKYSMQDACCTQAARVAVCWPPLHAHTRMCVLINTCVCGPQVINHVQTIGIVSSFGNEWPPTVQQVRPGHRAKGAAYVSMENHPS